MFSFISNLFESITHFISQVILLVMIVLAVVLLYIATNKNPDPARVQQRQQIEAENEAKYNAALERLYLENQDIMNQGR
jgi:hypothetical protein